MFFPWCSAAARFVGMAGTGSEESCKGCSSASCACGEKGTWTNPSLLSRQLSEDSSRHQLLQRWTSTWDCLSEAASAAGRTRREGPAAPSEEEDQPLVFLCAGCRRPLGDSLNWVTCQEDDNCILLRCQYPGRAQGRPPEMRRTGAAAGGRGAPGGRLGATQTLCEQKVKEGDRARGEVGLTRDQSLAGVPQPLTSRG